MSEDQKNLITFYSGLAMLGLLMRSKGAVMADELTADAIAIGKSMATELRRISDGSNDE